jgi:microcystin degradation protein MlrC
MRVAIASFEFEGNTLSTQLFGEAEFARRVLVEGAAVLPAIEGHPLAVTGALDLLRAEGLDLLPILVAHGGSGGRVRDAFYQDIRDRILAGLRAAGPLSGVFVALHGAMICETLDDPEGDLLEAVRALVGPAVPIAASLDLHAHVTPRMVAAADVVVGYETYPHDDAYTTGQRAAALLAGAMAGRIRPVTGLRRIDALLPVIGGATRDGLPMEALRGMARQLEAEGRALSVSYFPVQPWMDLPDIGIAGLAVTDADPAAALQVATEVVEEMWRRRRDFDIPCYPAEDAVRRALASGDATTLLSDAPDCVGGGAPGDNAAVLEALLRVAPEVDSVVLIVDPPAVQAAQAAGIGGVLNTTLGARIDPRFHPPVPVTATVESLHDGRFLYAGGFAAGTPGNMGPCAVLRHGGLRILVATHATYEYADEQYRACGLEFRAMRLAAFKNPMNFRNLLRPGTGWIAVDGPGPTAPRLENIAWQHKQRPFWPCDDAPAPRFMD